MIHTFLTAYLHVYRQTDGRTDRQKHVQHAYFFFNAARNGLAMRATRISSASQGCMSTIATSQPMGHSPRKRSSSLVQMTCVCENHMSKGVTNI